MQDYSCRVVTILVLHMCSSCSIRGCRSEGLCNCTLHTHSLCHVLYCAVLLHQPPYIVSDRNTQLFSNHISRLNVHNLLNNIPKINLDLNMHLNSTFHVGAPSEPRPYIVIVTV